MSDFIQKEAWELTHNLFTKLDKEWMLLGAAKPDGSVNMMTASWGGFGIYWGKPAAFTVVRPQRYTKEFMDSAGGYSLTFFPSEYKDRLNFCGVKSGRDYNKVKECGFDVLFEGGIPYFAQANLVFICKHILAQPLHESSFISPDAVPAMYPRGDFHTLYISEIVNVFEKVVQ